MYKHKYMFFLKKKTIYINIYLNLASCYNNNNKKTQKIKHDVNFIYEHFFIFEPCLTIFIFDTFKS